MGEPELTIGAGRRSLCELMWTSLCSESEFTVMDACQILALEVDVERSILTTDLVTSSLLLRSSRVSGQGR